MDLTQWWPQVVTEPLVETQEVEYKSPVPWQDNRQGIVRSVLSLSNTENGGALVVGVADNEGTKQAVGFDSISLNTYKLQTLEHELCSYASAGLLVNTYLLEHEGKEFLLVLVRPFEEYPILCMKSINPNSPGGVREGTLYFRYENCEDRAADNVAFRRIMERATRLALQRWSPAFASHHVAAEEPGAPEVAEFYDKEIEGL